MNSIVKHFIAEADISEFTPVKQGSKGGTVLPVTSPFDYVMGVAQQNVQADSGIDVMIIGETFVDCEGAVDGSAPLVANANGKAEQFNPASETFAQAAANTSVCAFARPIETDTNDAYLRCIVCPYILTISAAAEAAGG